MANQFLFFGWDEVHLYSWRLFESSKTTNSSNLPWLSATRRSTEDWVDWFQASVNLLVTSWQEASLAIGRWWQTDRNEKFAVLKGTMDAQTEEWRGWLLRTLAGRGVVQCCLPTNFGDLHRLFCEDEGQLDMLHDSASLVSECQLSDPTESTWGGPNFAGTRDARGEHWEISSAWRKVANRTRGVDDVSACEVLHTCAHPTRHTEKACKKVVPSWDIGCVQSVFLRVPLSSI